MADKEAALETLRISMDQLTKVTRSPRDRSRCQKYAVIKRQPDQRERQAGGEGDAEQDQGVAAGG